MTPLGFAATPAPIIWRARVRDHLATLPPGDPALDLAIIEGSLRGEFSGSWTRQQRVLALLRAARNDRGTVTLDGQRALLDALRERVA